jgi:hypothetical protein
MPPPERSTASDRQSYHATEPYSHTISKPKGAGLLGQQVIDFTKHTTDLSNTCPGKWLLRKQRNAARTERKLARAESATQAPDKSFVEEFLADPQTEPNWRQTTLDRLTSSEVASPVVRPRRRTNLSVFDVTLKRRTPVDAALSDTQNSTKYKPIESQMPVGVYEDHFFGVLEKDSSDADSKAWLLPHGTPGGPLAEKSSDYSPNSEEKQETTSTLPMRPDQIQATNHAIPDETVEKDESSEQWLIQPDLSTDQPLRKFSSSDKPSEPRRSTKDILQLLPKDDIDFLSASDIRATMGRSKGGHQDRTALREKLEVDFEAVHRNDHELDSMIEAQILNNQYIRRKERELLQSQKESRAQQHETIPAETAKSEPDEVKDTIRTSHKGQDTAPTSSQSASVLEMSLDFMSRWLHTGGNVFAQHFWQDPVQMSEQAQHGSSIGPFIKGILKGIQASHRAMSQVREDLAGDIPASQALLNRLRQNEAAVLSSAARAMGRTAFSADAGVNRNRVQRLQQALLTTDADYQRACETIDNMNITTHPSEALKRRLRHAAEVLHNSAKLTRAMTFGLHTRTEQLGVFSADQRGKNLAQHVLALHNTQTALSRLVERVMQAYGISAKAEAPTTPFSTESTNDQISIVPQETAITEKEKEREAERRMRNAAAEAKLSEEVNAQKAAMRGLSDDGYARLPKSVARKSFDEPNPLAHSLFRPFSLQLESLGKEVETEAATVKAAKKEKADKDLVKEVKSAYEDVYGPITVDHRQIPDADETSVEVTQDTDIIADMPPSEAASAQTRTAPSIQMLKEDEVSPTVTKSDPIAKVVNEPAVPTNPDPQVMKEDVASSTDVLPASVAAVSEPSTSSKFNEISSLATNGSAAAQDTRELFNSRVYQPSSVATQGPLSPGVNSGVGWSERTIYTYDAQSDEMFITTEDMTVASQTKEASIPLHEALATLSHPTKFLSHLPGNAEIITATPDMLVVRTTLEFPIRATRVVAAASPDNEAAKTKDEGEGWKGINPIDGTARLSPTGFVGDDLNLEKDFQERRKAAGEYHGRRSREDLDGKKKWKSEARSERKEKRKGGFGSVMKTAIVAAATCYVVGVAAELVR